MSIYCKIGLSCGCNESVNAAAATREHQIEMLPPLVAVW